MTSMEYWTAAHSPADRCLAVASAMLSGTGKFAAAAVNAGWWPKACACLIRLALEHGLDSYWQRTDAAIGACRSQRAKLVLLRRRIDRDQARRVAYAWAALSRLSHYQPYDAAPNANELRRLHIEVRLLVDKLLGG